MSDTGVATAKPQRRHDLDALRGFAMLLGIALHAALAFFPAFWPAQDNSASVDGLYDEFFHLVHGFRMPLFFLLSGFFTGMLWRRRGLGSLIEQRLKRIALPLVVGLVTIVPLVTWVSERASADQSDGLIAAVFFQNESAVESLLDEGVDPNDPKGESGDSPLHIAALVNNPKIAQMLLDAGANAKALDDNFDTAFSYAYFVGAEDVADVLVANGFPDIRPAGTDWEDLDDWGFGAAEFDEDFGLDSWTVNFAHLWFLWFLLWLVAGFAVVALIVERDGSADGSAWPRWVMWGLVPLVFLPQLAMGDGGDFPVFGPDTSAGLVPIPHVLVYYAVFFAFGALMYQRRDRNGELYIDSMGRRWPVLLAVALIVVFPLTLGLTFGDDPNWGLASIGQVVFAWAMIFGLMGAFRAALSTERRGIRYLSDSSYWLYLAHLPLIIALQWWVRDWDMAGWVKFAGINVVAATLLLATYQLFIRYTPIGTMLNGKRTRSSVVKETAAA